VTQARLSPDLIAPTTSARPDDSANTPSSGPSHLTFWLFGLTAMTLVFASLLLLGLLMRSGAIDAGIRSAVGAYAALIAGVGLMAVVYVLAMGRRLGLFGSMAEPDVAPEASIGAGDLAVAPIVLPRIPLYRRQENERARRSRSRQARAIAAAAARSPEYRSMPPIAYNGAPGLPQTYARPTAMYASAVVSTRPSVVQRPVPFRPATIATSPGPIPATPPRVAQRITMPSSVAARPRRPAGAAPAHLWMSPAPAASRAAMPAFQVRAASLRAPFWDGPPAPTLADRMLGRGTHRPSTPAARQVLAPSALVTPRSMTPNFGRSAAPARVAAPSNDARIATPSGRGAAW
jgi:hypothetical protein